MKEGNSVEVRGIRKTFTVGTITPKSQSSISVLRKRKFEERVVLKGISFEVKKGESVGLLGRNGSGKSTILKMLSKVMYPDFGEIEVRGRVASILELGMGFHQELSGRENIYIKGSMYGLSAKDMDAIIEDIIEFSELRDRIDDPLRVYSSGMHARLAFAIAIHIKSDVMIIDEVLSVGDIGFRSKCNVALRDLKKGGTTILLASHSMSTVEEMCDRVIWIEAGKVREIGETSAVCYHYRKDLTDSFESIVTSAESGDIVSQNNLGVLYRDGRDVEANQEEAFKWFKKAAESGLTEAQLNLGEMMLQQNNTPEGKKEACVWFNMAADAGNTEARIRVAEILSGDEEDDGWDYCVELLTALSEKGNARAQATLARVFLDGIGVPKDQKTAFKWFYKSAESGDIWSQHQIGVMYRDGIGMDRNPVKAVEWLTVSANNGNMKAKTELASMFKKGMGVERDLSSSLKWYREAARAGDANSMYQVATMCRDGVGTEVDMRESNRWFNAFSKQSRLKLQNTVGEICRYDIDTDTSVAVNIYEKGAKNGNIAAEFTFGMLKKDGAITMADSDVAAEWFRKAAESGHINSQIEYGNILLRGIGVKRDPEAAFAMFKMAADACNHVARNQLGNMYRDGVGVERDLEKAKVLFRLAAEQGNKDAPLSLLKISSNSQL